MHNKRVESATDLPVFSQVLVQTSTCHERKNNTGHIFMNGDCQHRQNIWVVELFHDYCLLQKFNNGLTVNWLKNWKKEINFAHFEVCKCLLWKSSKGGLVSKREQDHLPKEKPAGKTFPQKANHQVKTWERWQTVQWILLTRNFLKLCLKLQVCSPHIVNFPNQLVIS